MDQSDLLATADGETLTPAYVQRRVDDWLARLDKLMADIRAWARAGVARRRCRADPNARRAHAARRCACTRSARAPPRDPTGSEVLIWPIALWVVGANGRVDILSKNGVYSLIDEAESFQPPQWMLYKLGAGEGRRGLRRTSA